ncbi:hypothetical protein [Flavobacterium ardleyense]|uniref:hypothetical protein n=1 Tax=Flavobacterium ardleyense TaxID=2038737 RepID=UPI00298C4B18|nr:hypothetical protein [Flavobacterium ardleyense]
MLQEKAKSTRAGHGLLFYFPNAYKSFAFETAIKQNTTRRIPGLPAVIPEGVNATRKSKIHSRWSWIDFLFPKCLQKLCLILQLKKILLEEVRDYLRWSQRELMLQEKAKSTPAGHGLIFYIPNAYKSFALFCS